MTLRTFALLFTIHILCITPTRTYRIVPITKQADSYKNPPFITYNGNNNKSRNNFIKIPAEIFTTYNQLPKSYPMLHNDSDDYIPYNSDKIDDFSWSLIKRTLKSTPRTITQRRNNVKYISANTENIIFSPFSVNLVLALLTEATTNDTQSHTQLLTTLGDIKVIQNLRNFYRKTLTSLKRKNPDYKLLIESRLYTDSSVKVLPSYAALLQSAYHTPVEQLDFANGMIAAEKINTWIERATDGHLQQLVSEESVVKSVMLLVNAIYFNGMWRRQFKESTSDTFFRTSLIKLKAEFMELTDTFYYYECKDLRARIVRLPYRGQKYSMFVLLPNEGQSINRLLNRVKNEQFKHMQWMMERTKLKVVLPKFQFDHKIDLKSILCSLGIRDIFTNKAEMNGMVENKDSRLMVSNIIQKSGIEVNEIGTVAYATTVVEIANRFGGESEQLFLVNRPFIFLIEEEGTGSILFAGKVKNPTI